MRRTRPSSISGEKLRKLRELRAGKKKVEVEAQIEVPLIRGFPLDFRLSTFD